MSRERKQAGHTRTPREQLEYDIEMLAALQCGINATRELIRFHNLWQETVPVEIQDWLHKLCEQYNKLNAQIHNNAQHLRAGILQLLGVEDK